MLVVYIGDSGDCADIWIHEVLSNLANGIAGDSRIGVDENDELAFTVDNARRHAFALAKVLREDDGPDVVELSLHLEHDVAGPIGRAVIDRDDLQLLSRVIRVDRGPDRLFDHIFFVHPRDDDCDHRKKLGTRIRNRRRGVLHGQHKPAQQVRGYKRRVAHPDRVNGDVLEIEQLVEHDPDHQGHQERKHEQVPKHRVAKATTMPALAGYVPPSCWLKITRL